MTISTRFLRLALLALAVFALQCERAYAQLEVFASFEKDETTDVQSSPGVRTAVSKRFPAWSGNSLEAVFPATGGTVQFSKIPSQWHRHGALLLFVWSAQPSELKLELRDAAANRFVKTFPVRTGANHLQLRLAQVQGVDLRDVRSLILESTRSGSFYLDYFALDRFHPVLQERGRWDVEYSLAEETPHVPWGRPLAGGPIKVFALADVADGRGIVELAQRLELNFKATTIGRNSGTNKWGFGDFYEQRGSGGEFWSDAYSLAYTYIADDLLNGPQYDVILWPGLHPWESYPSEVRAEVQRRVQAGTGLIFFHPFSADGASPDLSNLSALTGKTRGAEAELDRTEWRPKSDHYITRGVPLGVFPWGQIGVDRSVARGDVLLETSQGTPVLAVRNVGKGRVAAFGYTEKGMIPAITNVFETGLHHPYHDYLWSLVARAVVWAARREPPLAIGSLERSGAGVTVRLSNLPAGSQLAATVRNNFGEIEEQISVPAVHAAGSVSLPIAAPLQGGRHFLDVRLLERGRVHDWATLAFSTPSQVAIRELALDADRVKLGGQISARLRLSAAQPVACIVTARLFDNYDRLLDERRVEMTVQGDMDTAVSLNSTGALSHLARVDCEVTAGGVRSDRRIQEVFVLQPRSWDDYDIVMYRFGPDPIPGIWPAIDRQLRQLNVTTLSSYSLTHSKHANYNVQAQTRISGQESPDGPSRAYYSGMKKQYAQTHDKKVLVREHCLNDPAYRDLIRTELRQLTAAWVPFSPLSYYVYEEPSLTCYVDDLDLCFSSHCMAAMRGWLKNEYGAVPALNKQWGTGFATWDEVVPDDTYEAQARGNYASWADHRTFMEKTYADTFEFVLGELHKIDPAGILLNSGTQESGAHNGCDYSRINQFTKHLNAYSGGNQLDFHRNFNPDVKISGGAGYGVLGKDVLYDFYGNLFKGANGGAYIFWQYSTLDPDLTLSQSGKDMVEGFRELRGEGIGKLVGMGTPENNRIAIHYSYPSIHGAWIVDGTIEEEVVYQASSATLRRFEANRDGWVKSLRDVGLQFDFISYADVEKGGLVAKGYKTFVLPMSVALSDKEVTAIGQFVRQGGTVIADALPGVMDEHCTFRERRALADVFGIAAARVRREDVVGAKGEPGLKLAGAQALLTDEGRPMLIEHAAGSGRAYLLNYFLDGYPQDRLEGRQGPALEKLTRILTAAAIKPTVKLTSTGGERVADCETYVFNQGSTRLLGLVPDKKKPGTQKVRLTFDRKGELYDVRQKRYLGSGSVFETEIEPAVPRLFALVEARINGLDVNGPARARRGEEAAFDVRVAGVTTLRSVAKVVVTDPAGQEVRVYGGNRDLVSGAGVVRFRTALNDRPGVWRIAVTEVISGETAHAEIVVE
ncbi:MAG: beta-galactosidase trimerization domain-containing protein [Acidobacteriota bacterium]